MVPYTTVIVSTEPPKDHIIWSLFNFVIGNPFCLGFVALIYSIKARDRKMVGDPEGARRYSSTARSINIAATVLNSILGFSLLSLFFLMVLQIYYVLYYFYKWRHRY